MAFERLDSVVKRVVSRIANEVGEGLSVAAEPDAVKSSKRGPDAETPGQVRQEVISTRRGPRTAGEATQPGKAPASSAHGRGRPTQNPSALPPRRVGRPMLYVIEGGWTEAGGSASVQPIRRARQGGTAAGEFLKLVV